MSSSSDSEESMEAHSPAHTPPPPRLEEIKKNLTKVHNSVECMDFCALIDNVIQGIDTFDFQTPTAKNQFSFIIQYAGRNPVSLHFPQKDGNGHGEGNTRRTP
ncbi:hypothetical protein TNCT_603681 [Trichonephila clavata]|uniref:Uncharacterized protein n=1 Tax=Trichonephila clavata TaxID=2740835 RepID=A0A8X6FG05_TRICU|nr:hypothetical protein TNCT_603681 [Trichonephila clavata]